MVAITNMHFTDENICSILIVQNKFFIFGIFSHKAYVIIKKNVEMGEYEYGNIFFED